MTLKNAFKYLKFNIFDLTLETPAPSDNARVRLVVPELPANKKLNNPNENTWNNVVGYKKYCKNRHWTKKTSLKRYLVRTILLTSTRPFPGENKETKTKNKQKTQGNNATVVVFRDINKVGERF